jgi:hypothetical protein
LYCFLSHINVISLVSFSLNFFHHYCYCITIIIRWRGLCIRFVTPGSLAHMTALKGDDELESVNDILLEDHVKPEGFERIVKELPCEVTIVVKRGKQRWNGQFG